jgi:hypothetical protein
VPAGFLDCSVQLGLPAYCPKKPECWGGVMGLADSPLRGTPQTCDRIHVQQTYAAGALSVDVRLQSQLESMARVKRLCSDTVLQKMLTTGQDRTTSWQVEVLPPQPGDGNATFFRCLFSLGERDTPVTLQVQR